VGKVCLPVVYERRTEDIDIYIVPTLKQDLYLGIDFKRKFDLLPNLPNVSELDVRR